MKIRSAVLAAASALAIPALTSSAAISIGSEKFGSTTPGIVSGDQDLVNGDFLIHKNLLAPTTGDGTDEATTWSFDLSSDANYAAFVAAGGPITSAVLTLTLTQYYAEGPVTDLVRPVDLFPNIEMPHFLSAGETGSIQFQLLDYYSASDLWNFIQANNGSMPMIYADDAIVSYANIRILAVPATPVGATAVLAALFAARRRR